MPKPSQIDDLLRRLGVVLPAPVPARQIELPLGSSVARAVPSSTLDEAAIAAADAGAPAAPDFDLGSPLWGQMNKSAGAYDSLIKGRTANLRHQNPDLVRIAADNINQANSAARAAQQPKPLMTPGMRDAATVGGLAAGAGALGVGAYMAGKSALTGPQGADAMDSTDGTADLANESRPVPEVQPTPAEKPAPKAAKKPTQKELADNLTEEQFTDAFKRQVTARDKKLMANQPAPASTDPSEQAKAILDDLNARRRKAGGEVPEAKQMMAEANRLLAAGNQRRNAPNYKPSNAKDPREQAQILLQKLNADRMAAGGEVPHAAKVMAEVRRLQEEGDRMRWGGR
jgi:hypothetical protein